MALGKFCTYYCVVVVSILIISYVLGTIITIIRYYNYKVVQQGNHLKISYGLLM